MCLKRLFVLVLVTAGGACGPVFDPNQDFIVGGVDSLVVPEVVSSTAAFPVRLVGERRTCEHLSLTVTKTRREFAVTPMLHHLKTASCVESYAAVDTTVVAQPPHMDPFTLRLRRYKTSDLVRTIRVQ